VRRWLPPALVVATVVVAVAVLTLNNGEDRVWWFRGFVVLVAVLATRSLLRWTTAQPRPLRTTPARRWRWPWSRSAVPARRGTERTLHLARLSAGDAHRGLRPLLQEIVDERLRARHGLSLHDRRAPECVGPLTWELVRPDRPVPHDLRSDGLTDDALDTILADLEAL
jgi:hypothetical protein